MNEEQCEKSVNRVTGYGKDGWDLISSKSKRFWAPGALSPGLKQPGCRAYSPLSSAEVKNGGAIPLLPHMSSWHGA
jgi:hypothetical protein